MTPASRRIVHGEMLALLLALAACRAPTLDAICDRRVEPNAPCRAEPSRSDAGTYDGGDAGGGEELPSLAPAGTLFPLGLYDITTAEEMSVLARSGWNLAHSFARLPTDVSFLDEARRGGMRVLARLAGSEQPPPEEDAARDILALGAGSEVAYWDLPAQMRYWIAGEFAIVTRYAEWTRRYDPRRRPITMYIPSHYGPGGVAEYVPYLDVIPATVYTRYAEQPHAWARWRVESTLEAIRMAGASIGRDYLAGEKWPIAILQLFHREGELVVTPEGAYHDFWQALVSGARGILIGSYSGRNHHPDLPAVWAALDRAASELTGEAIDVALLEGEVVTGVTFEILAGPARTPTFRPFDPAVDLDFPAIDLRALRFGDRFHLIAVNSAEETVRARIHGLPLADGRADLPFEDGAVEVVGGAIELDFAPLGVRIVAAP